MVFALEEVDGGTEIIGLERTPTRAPHQTYADSYGGHGFLHPRSEAEAEDAFSFSCSDSERLADLRVNCSESHFTASLDSAFIDDDFIDESLEPVILQRVREQIFEQLALQVFAADPPVRGEPLSVTLPSCIAEDNPLLERLGNLTSHPDLNEKRHAIRETLAPQNMVRALMWNDRLQRGSDDMHCTDLERRQREGFEGKCISIQEQQFRLRNSFPHLWSFSELGHGSSEADLSAFTQESPEMGALRVDAYRLLGRRQDEDGRYAGSLVDTTRNGEQYYQGIMSQHPVSFRRLESEFNDAWSEADPSDSPLADYRRNIEARAEAIKDQFADNARARMSTLCNSGPTARSSSMQNEADLLTLARDYPNAVRQALLDMEGQPGLRALTEMQMMSLIPR